MSYNEQYGSREVVVSRDGITGRREWVCTWAERLTAADRPRIGSNFPGEPNIRCTQITYKGEGRQSGDGANYEYCRVTAEYATYLKISDPYRESLEFGGEVLETALGRTWQDAGTPVEQAFGVFYPSMVWQAQVVRSSIPLQQLLNALGKVNHSRFLNFARETVLFEGASAESQWDNEREIYIYRLTLRFLWRPVSHNVVWRVPRQARYQDGSLKWGNDGLPVFESGLAGNANWDRPYPALYASTDFNPLLGLPPSPPDIIGLNSNAGLGGDLRGNV